jgi:hypothetical protein
MTAPGLWTIWQVEVPAMAASRCADSAKLDSFSPFIGAPTVPTHPA